MPKLLKLKLKLKLKIKLKFIQTNLACTRQALRLVALKIAPGVKNSRAQVQLKIRSVQE